MNKTNEKLFETFEFLLTLKNVKRRGWIERKIKDPESIAEQSFQSIAIAMLLSDKYNLDFQKMTRMLILQDIATAIAGDLTPYDKLYFEKDKLHREALNDFTGHFSKAQERKYKDLWEEYYSKESLEAQIAKDILKIETAMQALEYEKKGYKNLEVFWDDYEEQIKTKELRDMFKEMKEFRLKKTQ